MSKLHIILTFCFLSGQALCAVVAAGGVVTASLCQSDDLIERIKGGQDVDRGDFTFTANIKKNGNDVCNAVLVDRKWILTLTECLSKGNLNKYVVYFKPKDSKSVVTRTIRKVVMDNKNGGIVLARLNKKVRREFDGVRPFDRLSTSKKDKKVTTCKAVGFSPDGGDLKEVDISLQSDKKCGISSNAKSSLCLSTLQGKICEEDNGTPIICRLGNDNNKWYLVGLSSVEKNCEATKLKGMKLSFYRDFIFSVIDGNELPSTETDCGAVPSISYGSATLDNPSSTVVGATANVTCEAGYETDNVSIECQENGVWSSSACVETEQSVCVEDSYACAGALNLMQVDNCTICVQEEACLTESITYKYATNVEVYNPSICEEEQFNASYDDCKGLCEGDEECVYVWTDGSDCKHFQSSCILVLTMGPTPNALGVYKDC